MAGTLLHHISCANNDVAAVGTGDRAAHEQQVILAVDFHKLLIADGLGDGAQLARHALAFNHTARKGACASTAEGAVAFLNTVRGTLAGKIVSFDCTGEAAAFADTSYVDRMHFGE